MQRLFCHTHIVRYDESNCAGVLTPTAFVRYMQDIAARDAEDAQLGGNGFWIVKRTHITFNVPVPIHTKLLLKTYGLAFTRITAQRGYEAYLEAAESPIISARTLWVFLDPRGRPTRLPEDTARIWLPDGPREPQAEESFPVFPDGEPVTMGESVRFADIDIMRHMNNAAAVEKLDNAAWEAYARAGITPDTTRFDALSYDIEYLHSPRFGEPLVIQSWLEPVVGEECARWQQVMQGDKVVVRAFSRWRVDAV
ncbi:hypothetical protein EPA93_12865 [Ktedonosporobacter rubrisoli]|uniref:Acyl-ACP thioesterase N-terminal hotdog domain-containing protein n=1 Tax=Ktedonosporobacter rubrisoli TaxID=2509675 RepID=A0A4P6JNG1_KTERU|nr:acyl-ACP thioesterase domain-containing protein [Ktedonosporobacter rubrisoli]QBD76847.1 hypothetical protein EPA93_12865 [Ktedonosporobacter rubrisoli]